MKSRFGLALAFAAGMAFGCAFCSYSGISAAKAQSDDQTTAAGAATLDDVVAQLKELNKTSGDTNALLHSSKLRVVTVINPGVD
jgi:hypothetical protein